MATAAWHELPDLARTVIQLLTSSKDVLACDRVCRTWRSLCLPLPSPLKLHNVDVTQAWQASCYNGRASSMELEVLVPAYDRSEAFEQYLGRAFKRLTYLESLKLTQASKKVVGRPIVWFMPASLGQLTALKQLTLTSCHSLYSMPDECLKDLGQLQELIIEDCNMPSLPDSIKLLTALTTLSISKCRKLLRFDKNIGRLSSLQQLLMSQCDILESLPSSLGDLGDSLRVLSVKRCNNLAEWPPGIAQLHKLQELTVAGGGEFILPVTLENLTSLTKFQLAAAWQEAGNIVDLHGLQCLVFANVGVVDFTQPLVGLYNLTELRLNTVTVLATLPDTISCLSKLEKLMVQGCTDMAVLSDTGALCQVTTLTSILLTGCPALQLGPAVMDSFSKLVNLKELTLSNCTNAQLRLPPRLEGLSRMTKLRISGCDGLGTLPYSIGSLSALEDLDIDRCKALTELPLSMGQLVALQNLKICYCSSLTELPVGMGNLTSLTQLTIVGCGKLARLPRSMAALAPHLQFVVIYSCGWPNHLTPTNNLLSILEALEKPWPSGSPDKHSSHSPRPYSPRPHSPGPYSPGRFSPRLYSPSPTRNFHSPTRMAPGHGRDLPESQMPHAAADGYPTAHAGLAGGGAAAGADGDASQPMSPSMLAAAVEAVALGDPDDVWYPALTSSAPQDGNASLGAAAASWPPPPPPPPPPRPASVDLAAVAAAAVGDDVRSPKSPRSPGAASSNIQSPRNHLGAGR